LYASKLPERGEVLPKNPPLGPPTVYGTSWPKPFVVAVQPVKSPVSKPPFTMSCVADAYWADKASEITVAQHTDRTVVHFIEGILWPEGRNPKAGRLGPHSRAEPLL